jgi:hypothetical protein
MAKLIGWLVLLLPLTPRSELRPSQNDGPADTNALGVSWGPEGLWYINIT